MKFLFLLLASVFGLGALAQSQNTATIQWAQRDDTALHSIQPGFYLCMLMPKEYRAYGFPADGSERAYYISRNEVLPITSVDSVYKEYDPQLNRQVLRLRFNKSGAEQLARYTARWQGYETGLLISNRLVTVGTIPSSIHGGLISITADIPQDRLDELVELVRKS
jgi:preprotein translocase subunit SecD